MMRHQELMIMSSNIDQNPYLQGSLKEFLKLVKYASSNSIHTITMQLDLLVSLIYV